MHGSDRKCLENQQIQRALYDIRALRQHYRTDIDAGKAHGMRIAGYTLIFAQGDGAP